MSATVSTEIYGLKAALAELGKLDSKTKFKATNKIKAAGGQMVTEVATKYPDDKPRFVNKARSSVSWRG
jgi:hypothetical protein